MTSTPAFPSLRLGFPCNLGFHHLLALTAPAFAVSGRFLPFLESWGLSLLSLACLNEQRSVDFVYSPQLPRRASLPCTIDVSRPRTRDTTMISRPIIIVPPAVSDSCPLFVGLYRTVQGSTSNPHRHFSWLSRNVLASVVARPIPTFVYESRIALRSSSDGAILTVKVKALQQ